MTRLREHIHLVGSATLGTRSHPLDCHVYLLDGGDELALVDAGAGLAPEALLDNAVAAGHDPARIGTLLLTHGHGDHAGGAAWLRERLRLRVLAPTGCRQAIEAGDEERLSVAAGRRAGLYPPDFRLRPCPVDAELRPGEAVRIGALTLQPLDTPGHCRGHVSLLLEEGGTVDLLAGDAIFDGGRVALQPIPDCDIGELAASLRALRSLALDGLFAGHGDPVLAGAGEHVERANRALDRLLLPPPLIPADV